MPNLRLTLYALIAGAFLGIAIWLHFERKGHAHWRSEYARLEASYTAAKAAADEMARLNVVRVSDEQARTTEEITHDFQRDLQGLRADRDRLGAVVVRLRAQGIRAGIGADTAVSDTASDADEQKLCVDPGLLLSLQEIELARNALIDWVNEQSRINYGWGDNAATAAER